MEANNNFHIICTQASQSIENMFEAWVILRARFNLHSWNHHRSEGLISCVIEQWWMTLL